MNPIDIGANAWRRGMYILGLSGATTWVLRQKNAVMLWLNLIYASYSHQPYTVFNEI